MKEYERVWWEVLRRMIVGYLLDFCFILLYTYHRENVIKEKDGQLVHSENVIKEKDGQIADYVKKLFQMKEDLKNLQLQQSGTNTNSLLNSNGKRARSDPTSPNSTQKADNTSSPLILLSPNSYEYISAEISNDSFVETFEYNQSNSESIS